jgi:peroxiredoxin Q/BCP
VTQQGEQPPDLELPDQDGSPVRLSEPHGSPVVLYFYPRADTPGCRTQTCGIRDRKQEYDATGAGVWSGRAERTTFVIDEDGVLAKVLPKVSPKQHDDLVLAAL